MNAELAEVSAGGVDRKFRILDSRVDKASSTSLLVRPSKGSSVEPNLGSKAECGGAGIVRGGGDLRASSCFL